jgi:Right handed beta helix region
VQSSFDDWSGPGRSGMLRVFERAQIMKRCVAVPLAIAAAMVAIFLSLAPAFALQPRTWVSRTGDDGNTCLETAPCKTFAAAISKTNIHGEIDCLDSGDFSSLIIQKSITVDCHGAVGAIINGITPNPDSNGTGIEIDFDQFDPSDTPKQVIVRDVTIQGVGDGFTGITINGAGSGTVVNIENCVINGNNNGGGSNLAGAGIKDQRVRGILTIDNTKVRNNLNTGISIGSPNGSRRAVIRNTQVLNSGKGITVGANSEVTISHSDITDNATAGLVVSASTGSAAVDSSTFAHNGFAFQNSGTVRLSNSDVSYNSSGWTGTINTFTNNRFTVNGAGGPLVPIGTAVNPTGQQ